MTIKAVPAFHECGHAKLDGWYLCQHCGFSSKTGACAFPHCPSKRIEASAARVEGKPSGKRHPLMMKLEAAARQILCTDRIIRCVHNFELPNSVPLIHIACALTSGGLHKLLADHIPFMRDADRAIAFNLANINAEFVHGQKFEESVNGFFLHELSHVEVDDEGHTAQFWRCLSHLIRRGHVAGLAFDPEFQHSRYGMSAAEEYDATLAVEIVAADGLPLGEFLSDTEAPPEFYSLFENDARRLGAND